MSRNVSNISKVKLKFETLHTRCPLIEENVVDWQGGGVIVRLLRVARPSCAEDVTTRVQNSWKS